jgi:HSP20 family protein
LLREDPLAGLVRLQRDLDRSGTGDALGMTTTGPGTFPPINVFQRGDGFVVIAEAPGLDRETLSVEVRKNQLRIAGRRVAPTTEGMSLHRRERTVGEFDRTISLPEPIDAEAVSASYEDGMFIMNLPHAAEAKPRVIKIS